MSVLSPEEIQYRLKKFPGWTSESNHIQKTYQLPSFAHALLFAGAIGQLAEAADHHPDLHLHSYKRLTVTLSTHSAGGITVKDFDLAGQIEALPRKRLKK